MEYLENLQKVIGKIKKKKRKNNKTKQRKWKRKNAMGEGIIYLI